MNLPVENHSLTWWVTPDLLGILDDDGVLVDANPAWTKTLGWEFDEVLSRTFLSFLHADDVEKNLAAFRQIKKGRPILNFESRFQHKNGSYRWISWNVVPEGENYFCSGRDISDLKKNMATLRTKEEEAHLREQFVAMLGHDLRSPLASVRSALNIVADEDLPDEAVEVIDAANLSVDRMSDMIGNILDFASSRLGGGIC